jgi:hypothetical protein
MNNTNEIEVFYRGMALIGLLASGFPNNEELPEVAKDLASRMMEDSPKAGIVAIKPRKYNRK